MWKLDEWYDWVRAANAVISFISLIILVNRFRLNHGSWNPKTVDYWYSLTAWCVTGVSLSTEAILRDRPLGYTLALVFIASAVTLRGLTRKGGWGASS